MSGVGLLVACAMVMADAPPALSDEFSAQLLARLRGERVEDLSQRTERGSLFALPDGQWQQVVTTAPVW